MNNKIFKIAPLMFCFGTLIGCNNNPPAPDPKDPELVSIEVGKTPYCSKDVDLLKEDIEIRGTYNDGTTMRIYDWTCDDKNFFDEDGKHRWGTETSKTLNIESNGKKCVLTISSIADNFSGKVTEVQWKRLIANLLTDSYELNITKNDVKQINISKYINDKIGDIRSLIEISNEGTKRYEQLYKNYYWSIDGNTNEISFKGEDSEVLNFLTPLYNQFYEKYTLFNFNSGTGLYELKDSKCTIHFEVNSKKLNVEKLVNSDGDNYVFNYKKPITPTDWKKVNDNVIDTEFKKDSTKGTNSFAVTLNAKENTKYFFSVEPEEKDQDEFNKSLNNRISLVNAEGPISAFLTDKTKIYKDGNLLTKGDDYDVDDEKKPTAFYFGQTTYKASSTLFIEYKSSGTEEITFNFSYNIPAEK